MSGRLEERLLTLNELRSAELKAEWLKVLKTEPPKLSPDLMRLAIAFRLQERQLGAVPVKIRKELDPAGR